MLQSTPSARPYESRESILDSDHFFNSRLPAVGNFSLMSDSNLLSRIDTVRARLVPLRDGL